MVVKRPVQEKTKRKYQNKEEGEEVPSSQTEVGEIMKKQKITKRQEKMAQRQNLSNRSRNKKNTKTEIDKSRNRRNAKTGIGRRRDTKPTERRKHKPYRQERR